MLRSSINREFAKLQDAMSRIQIHCV